MSDFLRDIARDQGVIVFWMMLTLPMLGAMSLAQVWKLDRYYATGCKPPNHRCVLVSTLFGTALYTLVFGLMGAGGWKYALGVGVMGGPAGPLVWLFLHAIVPDRIARAMRGDRRAYRATWTEAERRQHIRDTLHGDDPTLQDHMRALREERDRNG